MKSSPTARQLKRELEDLLRGADPSAARDRVLQWPPRKIVNPLFSLLHSTEPSIRWQAVALMGLVTGHMADTDMEDARVVVRRLMWNLNDESGGIGWGSPEAMGEILARHPRLAREYAPILVSYIRPDGNYLEHDRLQEGVLWGLGRLAHVRPEAVREASAFLAAFFVSPSPALRGLAAWVAGALSLSTDLIVGLEKLTADGASLSIWLDGRLAERTVAQMAREALGRSTPDAAPPLG